jgi:SPOR domain
MVFRKHTATAWSVSGVTGVIAYSIICAATAGAQAQQPPTQAATQSAAEPAAAKKAVPKQTAEAKAAKKDPAQVQQTIEQAQKLLQAGKADNAVSMLSGVISGGNLPGQQMARALYVRGLAHRKMSKPALAISDLQSALWIKNGLTDTERSDALQNRAAAYRDAGLPDQDDGKTAAAPASKTTAPASAAAGTAVSSAPAVTAPAPKATAPAAAASSAPAAAASESRAAQSAQASGLGGMFGNLFSGGSASAPAATTPASDTDAVAAAREARKADAAVARATTRAENPLDPGVTRQVSPVTQTAPESAPAPAPATAPAAAPAPAAKTAAAAKTPQPKSAAPSGAAASAPKVAAAGGPTTAALPAATPGAQRSGAVQLQLGLVRTESEARAAALKAQQQLGTVAGAVSIDQTQVGTMGTFYRVRMGAFPTEAEGAQQCAKVKAAGVDCLPIAQ